MLSSTHSSAHDKHVASPRISSLRPVSSCYTAFLYAPAVTQDWETGRFVAVQWRTELSNGDLTECYEEVQYSNGQHVSISNIPTSCAFSRRFLWGCLVRKSAHVTRKSQHHDRGGCLQARTIRFFAAERGVATAWLHATWRARKRPFLSRHQNGWGALCAYEEGYTPHACTEI